MRPLIIVALGWLAACSRGEVEGAAVAADAAPVTAPSGGLVCEGADRSEGRFGRAQLAWDHAYWCLGAAPAGEYRIVVPLHNVGPDPVRVDRVELMKVTPRPLQMAWEQLGGLEKSMQAKGLPAVIAPGGKADVEISGKYLMDADQWDQSQRANLHVAMHGHIDGPVDPKATPVKVEITVHLLTALQREEGAHDHRAGPGGESRDHRGKGKPE